MSAPKRERRRFAQLLYTAVAGFLGMVIGLVLTIVAVNVASRAQKAATCAVVETSRAEKRTQLQAFEETPPTTDAGRSQQDAYRQSLAAWDGLWNQLNCKEAGRAR